MVSVRNEMRDSERLRCALQRFRSELALEGGDDRMVFGRGRGRRLGGPCRGMVRVVHSLNAEADMKEVAKESRQHLAVPLDTGLFEFRPTADPKAVGRDACKPGAIHDRAQGDLPLADRREELQPAGLNLPLGNGRRRFHSTRCGSCGSRRSFRGPGRHLWGTRRAI